MGTNAVDGLGSIAAGAVVVASTAVSAGPCISDWLRGAGWGLVGGDILSNLSATSRAASRKSSAADCAVSESASSRATARTRSAADCAAVRAGVSSACTVVHALPVASARGGGGGKDAVASLGSLPTLSGKARCRPLAGKAPTGWRPWGEQGRGRPRCHVLERTPASVCVVCVCRAPGGYVCMEQDRRYLFGYTLTV